MAGDDLRSNDGLRLGLDLSESESTSSSHAASSTSQLNLNFFSTSNSKSGVRIKTQASITSCSISSSLQLSDLLVLNCPTPASPFCSTPPSTISGAMTFNLSYFRFSISLHGLRQIDLKPIVFNCNCFENCIRINRF